MADNLTVGLIGVSAERGWARDAHVPAITTLAGLELAAVATRSQKTADAAADAFGAKKAYGDSASLLADPDVDVISVTTAVPGHYDLISAALRAGKHVFSEWPVAATAAQTNELAELAHMTGRHVAVGLQARMNPAAIEARSLIRRGHLGRVLFASVESAVPVFGRAVSDDALAMEKPETGMNLPTIIGGHTLDFATWLAGGLAAWSAQTTIQYPLLDVGDPPEEYRRSIADHVLLHGRLTGGAAFAAQIVGGRPTAEAIFRLHVAGEDATLTVTGGGRRGFQAAPLALALNGASVAVDAGELADMPGAAINTAGVYAALRDDIRHGTNEAPGLDDAVRLAHLIEDIVAQPSDLH